MRDKQEYNLDQFNLSAFDEVASETNHSIEDGLDPITHAQQMTVYSLFGQLGLDKTDFKIEKVSKMTKAQAMDLIDQLIKMQEEKEERDAEDDFEDYYGEIGEDLKF
ncbi:MAG: hypothetical protein K0R00_2 [Herbinix sp.]|jgi:hypothetical protein|nr:hypothetical protein [Herbinix sp.]